MRHDTIASRYETTNFSPLNLVKKEQGIPEAQNFEFSSMFMPGNRPSFNLKEFIPFGHRCQNTQMYDYSIPNDPIPKYDNIYNIPVKYENNYADLNLFGNNYNQYNSCCYREYKESGWNKIYDFFQSFAMGNIFGNILGKLDTKKGQQSTNTTQNVQCNAAGNYLNWYSQTINAIHNNQPVNDFSILEQLGSNFRNNYNNAVSSNDEQAIQKTYKQGMEAFAQQDFARYDKDSSGKIDKNEFIQRELEDARLTLGGDNVDAAERAELAGKTFDTLASLGTADNKNKGYIDLHDFATMYAYMDRVDGTQDSHINKTGLANFSKIITDGNGIDELKKVYSYLYQ